MLQLLRQFAAKADVDVEPVVKISRLKNKAKIQAILENLKVGVLFPFKIFVPKKSIYHGPDFKLNVFGFLPRIVTVHDMVVFEGKYNRPEFYLKGMRDLTKVLNSSRVSGVIVNSEFTKSEVLKYFPHLQDKIHVTYLGCNRKAEKDTQDLALPEKYILFLGTLEKRKNVLGVVQAFEKLKAKGFEHRLVLAGAWGYEGEEIKTAIEKSPFKNDITHLSYVPDKNVQELYKRAAVFFFPSWYEGFGIPALEAMALGCPVVISAGGALQEICADAALAVNPGDASAMANALEKILSDDVLRKSMIEKGLTRVQAFTWERCAEQTIEVYKKILGNS
ncbi:glycosyltransferase family 4 protein [Bdellovibrio bacteriovorus]